ncbi:hypothetical protein GE21DRAFT_3714 [Neurospora crassa]|uniref:Surface protein 1 n=1 Tax=Neurospora crassa (strain ATCC 24698 / 74-OR23-1A / CBS 708.71 / DSM 1257 / FGSC 987) TaxID=367110 RepID=Q7S196_NEUCR|nr:surface protein 1 [Neurospora crassa OR74A]EAA29113.1 surface protein 1 [Neurospora crassa OR74A]KHE79049.1 hypothetical protein GE21DRAFT_3714 [Neurospora crassa]|eukprot:XP_958349.1 surface protein 1 [Neurospora crassa OR74A]
MPYTSLVLTFLLAASHVCHGKPLPTPDDRPYHHGFPPYSEGYLTGAGSIATTTVEITALAEETIYPVLYPSNTEDVPSTSAEVTIATIAAESVTVPATAFEIETAEVPAATTSEEHTDLSDDEVPSNDTDSSGDEASSGDDASSNKDDGSPDDALPTDSSPDTQNQDHPCGRFDPWTIHSLSRNCDDADTVCDWSFIIDTHCPSFAPTPCSFSIKSLGPDVPASRSPKHEKSQDDLCGPYEVHSSWSGQFGPGEGFTTLSVIDDGNKLVAYPAYRDDLFGKEDAAVPDVEVAVYALG